MAGDNDIITREGYRRPLLLRPVRAEGWGGNGVSPVKDD